MFDPTPYRKKQILAVVLLIVAALGMGFSHYMKAQFSGYEVFFFVLEHGWEGALVGGLCDWFAVWKTYNAIEKDSETVAEEIGNWVSKDLLNQETLHTQLSQILNDPGIQAEIIKIIETYFDTHENTKKVLNKIWTKLEAPFKEYIVQYRFNPGEIKIITETTQDKIILTTVKICIGDTLVSISQDERFKKLVREFIQGQHPVARLFTLFFNVPDLLQEYGKKLKSGESFDSKEEKYVDELVTVLSLSMDKYILSWQSLSLEERTLAVDALFFKIQELVGNTLARFIMQHKEAIKASRTLGEYQPVRDIYGLIESRIDMNVSRFIGEKISERLKSQDPKDFREKLEWQTRNVLESIRINGTILGFVLGLLVGVIQKYF
jgi:uncharacterized membrane-anchored protein YjiN (DUF445 family)